VAHYPLNGNANDESTNGYHGTIYGVAPVSDRFGFANGAYDFDGADDRIDINAVPLLQELSINAWFRIPEDAEAAQRTIVGADGSYKLSIRSDGTLKSNSKAGTSASGTWTGGLESSNTISQGVWHHVSWSRSSTGYQYLYLDGDLIGEGQYNSGAIPQGYGEFIGMDRMFNGTMRYHWNGCIDDVRIYDRVLSSYEVLALYEEPVPPGISLEIDGSPEPYGEPQKLGYGTHQFAPGTVVSNSVETPTEVVEGTRRACTGWTGTGNVPAEGDATTVSFTLTEDSELTWQWVTEYLLDTESEPNGTVDIDDGWYTNGTEVTVTATPSNGYEFAGWEGDVPEGSETNNPVVLTMDQVRDIVAVFSPVSVPQDGPILHYTFDEDGLGFVHDDSGNGWTGVVHGATWSPEGVDGGAYSFDGTNDHITLLANQGVISGTGSFSLAAWAKVSERGPYHGIMQQRDAGSVEGQFMLWIAEQAGYYEYRGGRGIRIEDRGPFIEDEQWHHVAFTREGSVGRLYVDGLLIGSDTNAPKDISASRDFAIGCDYRDSENYLEGMIDDVRVYSYALSSNDVVALYEEIAGSEEDEENTVICLDGDGDYVAVSNTTVIGQVSGTVALWAYFSGMGDSECLFSVSSSSDQYDYFKIQRRDNNHLLISSRRRVDRKYNIYRESLGYELVQEQWHHIVVSQTGTGVVAYIDGVAVALSTGASQTEQNLGAWFSDVDGADTVSLGAIIKDSPDHIYTDGKIDEVSVWSKVLSASEVSNLYDRVAFSLVDPGLVAYWSFENDSADDLSGNGNNGVLVGDTTFCEASELHDGDLVLHYTFDNDEGTNVWDSSGLGNHGIAMAPALVSDPDFGQVRVFDNDALDHIEVENESAFDFGARDFSIGMWIKPELMPPDQDRTLISKYYYQNQRSWRLQH